MIVVSMMGGLGNQMFQYAFGRGVAEQLRRSLALDVTMLPTGSLPYVRTYELGRFPRLGHAWKLGFSWVGGGSGSSRNLQEAVGRLARARLGRSIVREPKNDGLLDIQSIPRGIAICVGYWQMPSYFSHIAAEIRHELEPPIVRGSRVYDVLKRTAGKELIAVHVRRGDYVTDARVRRVHGVLDSSYFERAVNQILRSLLGTPTVVVLSEDPAWAEANLHFEAPTIHAEVEESLSALQALALMRQCHHHVLSNSSLSWWGAWLAFHDQQVVIRPKQWFVNRPTNAEIRYPTWWRALDVGWENP